MESVLTWVLAHTALVGLIISEVMTMMPTKSNGLLQLLSQILDKVFAQPATIAQPMGGDPAPAAPTTAAPVVRQ